MKLLISFVIFSIVLIVPSVAIPLLPGVGGKPSKADRKEYSQRAENYDGKQFHNEKEIIFIKRTDEVDENRISKKPVRPEDSKEIPVKNPEFIKNPALKDFSYTWFGHSTLFIQIHGLNILVDPVFSERISPVSWIGPKKFVTPSVDIQDLPEIDILILSHDHYDHLDYKCIKKIDSKVKKYVCPLGVESHLKKWKVDSQKISNMAWWEEIDVDGLKITATPAQHFSGRWITGRNRTLWCGYVLKDEFHQVFYSGDSGYGEHFKKIHEKFGDFDFAIMECGQYDKRWPMIHSFPEESVQEAIELGAKVAVPVHWGAVVLSSNGWDDSVLRFSKEAEEKGLNYITPYVCQTVFLSSLDEYKEKWFR